VRNFSSFRGSLRLTTRSWEAYWNIGTTPGWRGQTLFKLEEMHQRLGKSPEICQYDGVMTSSGPAIRMGPNEIHVYDPDFYHELYRVGSKYYKDPEMHKVLGAPSSTLAECDPVKHKIRRAPLDMLFAKSNIAKLEPLLLNNIDECSERFDDFYAAGKPVYLEWALKSLAMGKSASKRIEVGRLTHKDKTPFLNLLLASLSMHCKTLSFVLCLFASSLLISQACTLSKHSQFSDI